MSKSVVEAEVLNIEKNIMGTISIEMKVKPMRKAQSFTVYPITKDTTELKIQSGTRIARVSKEGKGLMSQSHQSGAYFAHLQLDKVTPFTFGKKDWEQIKDYIGLTAGKAVGNSVIKSDNSGAKSIFGL